MNVHRKWRVRMDLVRARALAEAYGGKVNDRAILSFPPRTLQVIVKELATFGEVCEVWVGYNLTSGAGGWLEIEGEAVDVQPFFEEVRPLVLELDRSEEP